MKGLFITHDVSHYGASRSLQLLLRGSKDMVADLLVQRPFTGRIDHADLRSRFGPNVRNILEAWLPFDPCYQYGRKGAAWSVLYRGYELLRRSRDGKRVSRTIQAGKYDFIHLNSLVLHQLISRRRRCILHMRDIYDGSNPRAIANIQQAAGVIFIDEATREPFRNMPLRAGVVLNNPIDMSGVVRFRGYRPPHPNLDVDRHTIFSVIGVVSRQKGAGFIVGAFLRHANRDARLLIVGGREQAALREYRRLARNDPRIIFWGEEQEIEKIYAFSDYILRGEEVPCVGRTVYEGLYAGCRVILPGDPGAPPPLFELDRYRDAVFFYRPRDEGDLLRLFDRLTGRKVRDRELRSNTAEYAMDFQRFVTSVMEAER